MRMWKIFGVVGVMMLLGGCETASTSPQPSPGGEGGELSLPGDSSLGRVIDSPAELPLAPSIGGTGTPNPPACGHPLKRGTDSPALTGTPSQRGRDSIREYYERMELLELLYSEMDFEGDK